MSRTRKSHEPGHQRKFLVVIDDTPECDRAVYYGSRRAARTNAKLTMLTVIPVGEVNQQWLGVGDLMRAEAHNIAGIDPERIVREGNKADEVLKAIDEDEDIAVLVLAAGTGKEGPGPLVSSIVATGSASFPIPITIVPGSLSDEELDALA